MNRFALLALFALAPGLVHAQVDAIEAQQGPTHIHAIAGDGGLSVGIAPTGEITQLLWPSPLGLPAVRYQTAAVANARDLPRFGAAETDGMFFGLWVETAAGSELSWLRDAPWTHDLTYDGAAIVHTAFHAGWGVRVITHSSATGAVLTQRVVVERADASPVLDTWVVGFADLDPAATDWFAYWDPAAQRLHSFAPDAPSDGRDAVLDRAWTAADWADEGLGLAETLAASAPGVHLAVAGPEGALVHVGARTACGAGEGTITNPASAWDTLASATALTDLTAPAAGCDTDVALAWPVEYKDDGPTDRGAVDVFLAAGDTWGQTAAKAEDARSQGFEVRVEALATATASYLDGLTLPVGAADPQGDEVTDFAERWALSARTTIDSDSGALASSLASQPRLNIDEPAKSVWTELALELAGEYDIVSAHQQWIGSQQLVAPRIEDGVQILPPGAWASGDTFDLGQVGLSTWSALRHAQFASNERKARAVLAASFPMMARAADLLTTCVADSHPAIPRAADDGFPAWWPLYEDLQAGTAPDALPALSAGAAGAWEALRPCASWEDGAETPQASLYSTHLARLGLVAAVAAAEALCLDDERVAAWQVRADELGALALAADYDGSQWTGRGDLLAWPIPLTVSPSWWFAFATSADPVLAEAEVEQYVDDALSAWVAQEHTRAFDAIALRTDGTGDESLALLAGGRWRADSGDRPTQSQARALLERLVTDLTTEGTGHLGAAFVVVDGVIEGADQRVGQPYLPSASQAVAALMSYSNPDLLAPAEEASLQLACPDGEEPNLQREAPGCGADCESSLAAGRSTGTPWAVVLVGLLLGLRRRR